MSRPTLRPAANSRSMPRDASLHLEKAAIQARAPVSHQLFDRGVALPPIDHGEWNPGAAPPRPAAGSIGEVRRDEDGGPAACATCCANPPRSTTRIRPGAGSRSGQHGILHQGAADAAPDPAARSPRPSLRDSGREGHAQIEQHVLMLARCGPNRRPKRSPRSDAASVSPAPAARRCARAGGLKAPELVAQQGKPVDLPAQD